MSMGGGGKASAMAAQNAAEQNRLIAEQNAQAAADRAQMKADNDAMNARLDAERADAKARQDKLDKQIEEQKIPVEAPDTDSPYLKDAKAMANASLTQRSGRRSTILTAATATGADDNNGRPYAGQTLGTVR